MGIPLEQINLSDPTLYTEHWNVRNSVLMSIYTGYFVCLKQHVGFQAPLKQIIEF